jgi:hypothetical protein
VTDAAVRDGDFDFPVPEGARIILEGSQRLLGSLDGIGVDAHGVSSFSMPPNGEKNLEIRDFV